VRRLLLVGVVAALLLGLAPAAGAIETTRFGIAPAAGDRLEVDLRPGKTTTASFDVWNKQSSPLALDLSVSPATIAADGTVALRGPAGPVRWADVPERVELAPGQRRAVELEVRTPRRIPDGVRTIAVLAVPAMVTGEAAPAVLQRLALVAHLERAGSDLPDLWPWAGVAILAIVAVVAQIVVSRRRRFGGSRSR
jgi:hypothetical protein